MPANYVLLERIELNATTASVSFTNIPQSGYTDLKIVGSIRNTLNPNDNIYISFNSDTTGSNYSSRQIYGTGSAVGSEVNTTTQRRAGITDGSGRTANTFSNTEIYIPNYLGSTYKSYSSDSVEENNATTAVMTMVAGIWNSTAAINSITFTTENAGYSFVQYSTFSLYGLAAVGTTPVIAPKASGGNITTDGTYWIHTFLTSGTFTPSQGLTCDYLVVAGGGAGGGSYAYDEWGEGGGGAGGFRSTVTATGGGGSLESALTLAASTNYTVTIGAGGTGGSQRGGNGSNSVFSTITATGGGGGGGHDQINANSGGSGGGGAGGSGTAGSGTANQGYAGGAGTTNRGGGGGGAGAIGQAAGTNGGNGGNGVATSITGTSVTYAGGGGGGVYNSGTPGTGGSGGGGAGAFKDNGVAGTTNTGGGGGGSGNSVTPAKNGGNGGSGIVIVRYLVA